MSDVEELLTRTLRDPARELPVPPDPLSGIRARARAQRRDLVLRVALVVLVVAAAVAVPTAARLTRPAPVATDPPAPGLLPWRARGPLAGDAGLVRDAARQWPVDGTAQVLWAGRVGGRRLVLLQGVDAGTPTLAEVADAGAGPRLVATEPLTDPGTVAVRLSSPAGIALVVHPDGATVGVLDGPGGPDAWRPIAADGLLTGDADLTGDRVAVLDRDEHVLGDGAVPVDGPRALTRGPVRLARPTWRQRGGDRRPQPEDYADGAELARRLGGGPVEVSVLDDSTELSTPDGDVISPRLVELRRGGQRYHGSLLWQRGGAVCVQLAAGPPPDVLVARCRLPGEERGSIRVLVREGIRVTEIRLDAAGPAERPVRIAGTAIGDGYLAAYGADLPTGPGIVELEDAGGQARPPLRLPPYS